MHLNQTTKEVLNKIQEAEANKLFHIHVDPIGDCQIISIDDAYSYQVKWHKRIGYFFMNQLIVKPYRFYANHVWFHTKIIGRENSKGISTGAILTCNHINKLDSLVVGHAFKTKRIRYTAAEFNNFKGGLGSLMRAYGMLSIPSKPSLLQKFSKEIESALKRKEWVLFFPEGSEWWCYEKPRPYQMGAFHYAAKYNVPILPLFITFIKTNLYDSMGVEKRKFVLHILRPIYPKASLSLKENKKFLKEENERVVLNCYQRFYSN